MKTLLFCIGIIVTLLLLFGVTQVPYFPGDITIARTIQSVVSAKAWWIGLITKLATFPWYFLLLLMAFLVSLLISGIPGAVLSLLSFGSLWILDKVLRFIIFQPRPSPDFIYVDKMLTGSAFPSSSALIYMATFGFLAVLALKASEHPFMNGIVLLVSSFILVLTLVARVAVGAHWPSDMLISYILGLLVIVGGMSLYPFLQD